MSGVKEISASSFDFLYIELVDYILRSNGGNTEAAAFKLERIGFRIGQRLIERYTKDRARFHDNLEIIKFMCKEFWVEIFKKQIDNLRTNHRGVFVLQDNKFRWLANVSSTPGSAVQEKAGCYVVMACGLIRGALSSLGVSCVCLLYTSPSPRD
eukprot:TRINITY_DN13657_c0_g1_i1.p1 TRINITY_DN13657_c0_g1~~TRINITY_DN13657_c0_g1_i1.p1  ORF type:complete len:178 (+),score=20.44 TRINITY_DN13657_c0_g1_i1:75-536(+)